MKVIFLLLCAVFLQLELFAQLMTVDEKKTDKVFVALNGKASVVIISPHDDLVIESSSTKDGDIKKEVRSNKNGEYEYEFLVDVTKNNQRAYNISRKGSALRTRIEKVILRGNERRYFYTAEVENPITIEKLPEQKNDVYYEKGKACIEFTTGLEGLDFTLHPKNAPISIKRSKNEAGANVISVIVDVAFIQKCLEEIADYKKLQNEYETLLDLISSGKASVEELDKSDVMKKQLEKIETDMDTMSVFVEIYGNNTNVLHFDLMDEDLALGSGSKKCIAIMALKEKVFGREYNQDIENAKIAEQARKYSTAEGYYEQALQKAETLEEKNLCEEKIREMNSCAGYMKAANIALQAMKLRQSKREEVEIDQIEECYDIVIANYRSLYQLRNDELFLERIAKLEEIRNNLDLVITGKVVHVKKKQGVFDETPMSGVDIYGIGIDRTYLGSVDASGQFKLQVKKKDYSSLLFVPKDKKMGEATSISLKGKHLNLKVRIYD